MQVALVGIGKIAKDQHVPAITHSTDWSLAATVSRHGRVDGIEAWDCLDDLLKNRPDIRVVSLCVPPGPRFAYAASAIRAGRHVMLEKPPGATLSECQALVDMAKANRVSLFATWHSREAQMVDRARDWLADRQIKRVHITWAEDVRHWHPGQDWVFEPAGMGVFDPGINALSILTKILPIPIHLQRAILHIPQNRHMPIAADLQFTQNVSAHFDWLKQGQPCWQIDVETEDGSLCLSEGGAKLALDGVMQSNDEDGLQGEYSRLYAHMARLTQSGTIDVDLSPLRHVADAFMLGERHESAPFHF